MPEEPDSERQATSQAASKAEPKHDMVCSNDGALLAAPPSALLDLLIPKADYAPSSSYIFTYLLNARMHTSPSDILQQFIQMCIFEQNRETKNFEKSPCLHFYQNIVFVMREWTSHFALDFAAASGADARRRLEDLSKICAVDAGMRAEWERVNEQLQARLVKLDRYKAALTSLRKHTGSASTVEHTATLASICTRCEPSTLAHQLTHIELERLNMIEPTEFLLFATEQSGSDSIRDRLRSCSHYGNIDHYSEWFNRLTWVIATEICRHSHKSHRKQIIEFYVAVAKECFNIGNFNSAMAITAALRLVPVARLRKTWPRVRTCELDVLEQQLDPSSNFSSYRATLNAARWRSKGAQRQCEKIIIPCFTVFLRDLLLLFRGCSKLLPNGYVDYSKWRGFAELVMDFASWKDIECPFPRDNDLLHYLLVSPALSDTGLLELASFDCETPDGPMERERWRTLKTQFKR